MQGPVGGQGTRGTQAAENRFSSSSTIQENRKTLKNVHGQAMKLNERAASFLYL